LDRGTFIVVTSSKDGLRFSSSKSDVISTQIDEPGITYNNVLHIFIKEQMKSYFQFAFVTRS
jgi:hypothetical protein